VKIFFSKTSSGLDTQATTDQAKADAFEHDHRGSGPETFEADLDIRIPVNPETVSWGGHSRPTIEALVEGLTLPTDDIAKTT